jgi:uncharacterized protein YndB with AHSA1/START domain
MAASKPKTATPAHEDFVISRTFDAPRHLVWKAWTEPEHLAQWWGPKGCTIRVAKFDLRPGGIFHYAMQFQPGHDMWARFIYREIAPPERIVFINSFSDPEGGVTRPPYPQLGDAWPLEVLNTVTLEEQDGNTILTVRGQPLNGSEEAWTAYVGMFDSMRQGFGGTFDKLAQHLAKLQGSL